MESSLRSSGLDSMPPFGNVKACTRRDSIGPPAPPVRAKWLGLAPSGGNWANDFEREGNCRNFEYVAVPRNHSKEHNLKDSDAPIGSLFSRKNVFGYIPISLLDLLTLHSTDVIFLLWNETLNSPTSSSAGGMASQRMSRTAWIKWSDFYRCVVFHSEDRTPSLFNLHGTRT